MIRIIARAFHAIRIAIIARSLIVFSRMRRRTRIKEIRKQLDDVPSGGWFYIRGYQGRTYVKTDRERNGTATVVDLNNGQMANLMTCLTVVEISKGGE